MPEGGGGGGARGAVQLTLSQPEGADYGPHIIAGPPPSDFQTLWHPCTEKARDEIKNGP